MADSQDKKHKRIVKRNQVADQCNRVASQANAGVFPRMGMNPTPWCAPRKIVKTEEASKSSDSVQSLKKPVFF
ncbi:MAG: hypothetical protein ACRBB4_16880 [Neptuniibacter sp.]|uniref:hypothetical protein n=1 Tax=Neptuniibacter sp. TaxID=1962643 RepID=UPI003B5B94ED